MKGSYVEIRKKKHNIDPVFYRHRQLINMSGAYGQLLSGAVFSITES